MGLGHQGLSFSGDARVPKETWGRASDAGQLLGESMGAATGEKEKEGEG